MTYSVNTKNLIIELKMRRQLLATLADKEDWAAVLEPALCQDKAAVECLVRLLFTIKRAIDSGPEGAMKASRQQVVKQYSVSRVMKGEGKNIACDNYVFPHQLDGFVRLCALLRHSIRRTPVSQR